MTTTNSTSNVSLSTRLFQDLKERLLKFGTVRGLILIPLGIAGLIVVLTNFKFILHALAALVFASAIVEGLYQLLHNPIKKQMAEAKLTAFRQVLEADTAFAQKDVEGFLRHIAHLIGKRLNKPIQMIITDPMPSQPVQPSTPINLASTAASSEPAKTLGVS